MTNDDAAVRETLRRISAAWDAHDADAFVAQYLPEAVVVLPGGVMQRGRAEICAAMAAGFAGPLRGTTGVDEPELVWFAAPGTAVVVSRTGFLMPGESALPPARQRRATWTLVRTEDGWRVAAYTNTPMES